MKVRELFRMSLPDGIGDAESALWFSADGDSLVFTGDDVGVLCAVPSGRMFFAGPGAPRGRHAFTRDGARVAIGGTDLRVLDTRTGEASRTLTAKDFGGVVDAALSPDGSLAAAVTSGGTAVVFDLATGERRYVLGGYVSRERWSSTATVKGARFSPDGRRLLTFGEEEEASWGVAAHHGHPDEEYDCAHALNVWDAATGEALAREEQRRSRYEKGSRVAEWAQGDDLILWARSGQDFRVLTADLRERASQWPEESVREFHATPDGLRVIGIDAERRAILWTLGDFTAAVERQDFASDPFNGFGLPATLGEPAPRYRVLRTPHELVVESWPERVTVATLRSSVDRVAVRPGSLGACFAGIEEGALSLWALEQ